MNDYTLTSTPSPVLFPRGSPTPKLTCHTPSKKPPSPFDWGSECFQCHDDIECAATANWHYEEIERIGMQLEMDPMVLERLREKANPTPEERYVLKWVDDNDGDNEPLQPAKRTAASPQQQAAGGPTASASTVASRARNMRDFFARFTRRSSQHKS